MRSSYEGEIQEREGEDGRGGEREREEERERERCIEGEGGWVDA